MKQQTSATERHLTATEKINSFLPQGAFYDGADII